MYTTYILASRTRKLYVGVTSDLERRILEHRSGTGSEFTRRYRIFRLVWYEHFDSPIAAIEAEKRIKGWTRARKLALVESTNAEWRDLYSPVIESSEPDRTQP
ncbi:MAG: GIY-YIG nuclease family protein [Armatimonadota bacterium]